MAFDKVVDSSVLDAGLKQIADAIREKGGTTGNLEFPAEMVEAITAIEAGGVELPTLEYPATEADVVSSKQFIDESGNLRTGSMGLLGFGGIVDADDDVEIVEKDDGSKTLIVGGYTTNTENKYVNPGSTVIVMMDETQEGMSVFGDAKPEDVREGKIFTSKEGFTKVGTHACSGGGAVRVKKPVVLEVEKITSNTYADSTKYENEVFLLLDIYPKSGGTVTVTYGDLTKTIVDDGTSEEPNAQKVFFGTFNGVADEVETPASGTLTIEGDYVAFAMGSDYSIDSKSSADCPCITNIVEFGEVEHIPSAAFGSTATSYCKIKKVYLPDSVKSIGDYAFAYCKDMISLTIPDSVTSIGDAMTTMCSSLVEIVLPMNITSIRDSTVFACDRLMSITVHENVTYIEDYAFGGNKNLRHLRILATTPPTIGGDIVTLSSDYAFEAIIVPAGCGEAYKTAEGWEDYADYIVEEVA